MRRNPMRTAAVWPALLLLVGQLPAASPSSAFEYYVREGLGVQVHGAMELKLATLSDGFREDSFFLSEFTPRLEMEFEFDLAPDGFLFFDQVSGFARVEARLHCVFKDACGLWRSYDRYGDDADHAAPNFTDGTTTGYSGTLLSKDGIEPIHDDRGTLLNLRAFPQLKPLLEIGGASTEDAVNEALAPVGEALFASRRFDHDNPRGPRVLPQGPWRTGYDLRGVGALDSVASTANPASVDMDHPGALLLRPRVDTLFTPSLPLAREMSRFTNPDQSFSENDLFFNHGASQDEGELREAYLDMDLFDSRLWLRLGKQNIVWGKTELFRTTDQLNPTDLAVGSLPSLEESRIPLWALRGIWSFYNVGPVEDLRLEVAVLLDDFEAVDLGFCGEPYTPFLVCGKSAGLFFHGITGVGLAGEERPPNWWEDPKGLELGARLEFRWERFSFALVDFWGYDDAPDIVRIHGYERKVDPLTGRPLDVNGDPFDTSGIGDPLLTDEEVTAAQRRRREALREQAAEKHPGNRQLFDFVCKITSGVASAVLMSDDPVAQASIDQACILDIVNNVTDLGLIPFAPTSAADALSLVLAGNSAGGFIAGAIANGSLSGPPVELKELNQDPGDQTSPPDPSLFCVTLGPCLSSYLTDQQEALLGCGPFYGTSCDKHGIDLFNAEFSVLGQRLPNVESYELLNEGKSAPVGTRVFFRNGRRMVTVLPGARGPADVGLYDPRVDGCVGPSVPAEAVARGVPVGYCAGADPLTLDGRPARSEMEVLSENFVRLLAALGSASRDENGDPRDPDCQPDGIPGSPFENRPDPADCDLVRAVAAITGVQRPEVSARANSRFGRRDFLYHGGGEAVLRYGKRNVLGFSADFAEDRTKTNWSLEFTWIANQTFGSSFTEDNTTKRDVFNLTISVDRLTFIRFLNPNRTFIFNTQWFFSAIEGWKDDRELSANGPVNILGTLFIGTAYWQDRLAPSIVFVHDINSASGGSILQVSYRYSEVFSVTAGVAFFYGKPRRQRLANYPLAIENSAPPYLARTNYQGLSPIAEREEIFLRLRYTF
jgi:hypothetical protein